LISEQANTPLNKIYAVYRNKNWIEYCHNFASKIKPLFYISAPI
jgi:hypothetical protein